jgi:hypothetical protein
MHVTAIPIVYDYKNDCCKISISELWKGKNSYRKFQDYMYHNVGKKYGFDRGEMHDFGEAKKHMEVEEYKLQEAEKSLKKLETDIATKEEELLGRAKTLEPEEQITVLNVKKVLKEEKAIHYALRQEKEKNVLLQREKNELLSSLKVKDYIILNQSNEIQKQQKKLSETEIRLSEEIENTNDILNIKVSREGLRTEMMEQAKKKIRLYDIVMQKIREHFPELYFRCRKFINDLINIGILSDKDLPEDLGKEKRENR